MARVCGGEGVCVCVRACVWWWWWMLVRRKDVPNRPYNFRRGGFDLYIDGARFLPYNCTISRVVGRIFGCNYEKEGHDIATSIELDSNIFEPEYNFRLEFRDVPFSPQATLLVKIYSIENSTEELVVIGYSVLNIFVRKGSLNQPSPNDPPKTPCSLNEGAHQLRLYWDPPDRSKPLSADALRGCQAVPCASLLVRLMIPPQKGGKLLSSSNTPKDQWAELGLSIPAPLYKSGAYFSDSTVPTPQENPIFVELVKRSKVSVRDTVSKLTGDRRLKDDKANGFLIRGKVKSEKGRGHYMKASEDFRAAARRNHWSFICCSGRYLSPQVS